ncbi:hypothetical protein RR46_08133 [Papilio xuthus]|uniref:Uncharacterized protein n=1 Tax=Papilio xuthus TaxID=66420 RepID=A0A194QFW2_PAPXU|nr:hypothetical protein RR46_08133 [Papilio xuthus]
MQRPYKRRYLRQNNMHEAFHGDFEYVITKKEPPRVCFGTGLPREVLPQSGPCLNPFMRRIVREIQPNVGPASYNETRDAFSRVTQRIYSKLYYGSKTPRWKEKHEYQPPPREIPPEKPIPKNCAPFNSLSKRQPLFTPKDYPA